jgi:hypothetical protein
MFCVGGPAARGRSRVRARGGLLDGHHKLHRTSGVVAVHKIYYYAPLSSSEWMAEWVCEVHAPVCLCALYFPVGPQLVPKGA